MNMNLGSGNLCFFEKFDISTNTTHDQFLFN